MRVVEQFMMGKFPDRKPEDVIVVTADYAAVVDGASTAATFLRQTDDTPGRLAALAVADVIAALPADADVMTAVAAMTRAVAAFAPAGTTDFNLRPNASVVAYSRARHEVWRVGDSHFITLGSEGQQVHLGSKHIDVVMASWRCAADRSLLARGVRTVGQLLADDLGRHLIDPFIARQIRYQNLDSDHRLAYGVVDGTPLPRRFVSVYPLDAGTDGLVLASDGYRDHTLSASLADSEAALARTLEADPLCIYGDGETKGIKPGAVSFDDRSFVRLALAEI